ncbi:MAG: 2-amino-4-hydroxy-6-hydroxymethyldihydropteridine diphosphokinase [SAR324 cluster bacterium]|uniref:2-amino-4-hydroxy-6-hydroxymethyldihydropteridine diphosphokinase n=1 Tax=SAR324 cluster bacterium TaxID=2024889 RepID=A0A2A4T9A7_9DELT|nr:MAG: 2-amino-4-hydroxy-6-hydroxymethyldihydropteridine diphosphokinase [SAR324 cluster bacterium]
MDIAPVSPLVYLALGSNLAPREKYIFESIQLLKEEFPQDFRTSSIYETQPFGGLDQPAYYNCCVSFRSSLTPQELLQRILAIEYHLGRRRSGKRWESRVIDIDIALFGQEIIEEADLIIPHYDLRERDFFLIPLLELDRTLVNPKTQRLLQAELKDLATATKTSPVRLPHIIP